LDARVLIELEHEAGTIIRAEATRSQAQNKLLYCLFATSGFKAGRFVKALPEHAD
jgi:hypothetical protein